MFSSLRWWLKGGLPESGAAGAGATPEEAPVQEPSPGPSGPLVTYKDWPPNYDAGLDRWFSRKGWKFAAEDWFDRALRLYRDDRNPEAAYLAIADHLASQLKIDGPAWMEPPEWPQPAPRATTAGAWARLGSSLEPELAPGWNGFAATSSELRSDDCSILPASPLATTTAVPDLDTIDPFKFEQLVCKWFSEAGWDAELSKGGSDAGVDVWVTSPQGQRGIVQCKRYTEKLGSPVVRDLWGALELHRCRYGFLVVTSYLTPQAWEVVGRSSGRITAFERKDLDRLTSGEGPSLADLLRDFS